MSYQEIFNVKYREHGEEGSLQGRKNHTEDNIWRGKKKVFFYRFLKKIKFKGKKYRLPLP